MGGSWWERQFGAEGAYLEVKTFGGHLLGPQEPGNHWRREAARPKPGLESSYEDYPKS